MIKKIILISVIFGLLYSCGKKDNPEYKVNKYNVFIFKV